MQAKLLRRRRQKKSVKVMPKVSLLTVNSVCGTGCRADFECVCFQECVPSTRCSGGSMPQWSMLNKGILSLN